MPTSSGGSYTRAHHGTDKLLSKRSTCGDRYPYKYDGSTTTAYSTNSTKSRTSYLLNSPTRSDHGLTHDFTSKLDLNGNESRSKPYKSRYGDDHITALPSTSSTTYGSHYKSRVNTGPSAYYSNSSSHLTTSSRSSPVDLGTTPSRTQRSNPAIYNYNDSCSSHDSETAMKSSSATNYDGGNVGLTNLGNTCFMNSVLQCLLNTKKLKEYVTGSKRSKDINRTTSSMKGALMEEYALLVQKVWENGSSNSIAPRELKSKITRFAPRFSGYNQQDAQEFLRYFLQGLHEDVNRVTKKPKYIGCDEEAESKMRDSEKAEEYWRRYINFDDSAIVDLFVGQLKSELICQTCGYKSVTFDPFWDLSLPIPKNRYEVDIQGCLESFMKEEILDGDERPTCAKCKVHRKCAKTFKIQKFPKILVLHLKRFSGERYRQKLSTKVNFELEKFNLRQFGVDTTTSARYNLYGISNHVGSVYSGHYTAYCKHPYKERWYSFNDSRVSSISAGSLVSEEAYVLFYELVE